MALEDVLLDIVSRLEFLKQIVDELESESESGGNSLSFGTSLPTDDLFSNRLFVNTADTTGGPGGTIYRFDSASGSWLRIS